MATFLRLKETLSVPAECSVLKVASRDGHTIGIVEVAGHPEAYILHDDAAEALAGFLDGSLNVPLSTNGVRDIIGALDNKRQARDLGVAPEVWLANTRSMELLNQAGQSAPPTTHRTVTTPSPEPSTIPNTPAMESELGLPRIDYNKMSKRLKGGTL